MPYYIHPGDRFKFGRVVFQVSTIYFEINKYSHCIVPFIEIYHPGEGPTALTIPIFESLIRQGHITFLDSGDEQVKGEK